MNQRYDRDDRRTKFRKVQSLAQEERKYSGASSHGGGEDGAEAWEIEPPVAPITRMTGDMGMHSS
jgi:hypothetical protein